MMNGGVTVKKILLVTFLCFLSVAAFSQIGTDIFGGFGWGIGLTPTGTAVFHTAPASDSKLNLIDLGLLVDYEIANGFKIGGGIGGAYPMATGSAFSLNDKDGNEKKIGFMIDGLVGVSYSYPLEPVVLKANIVGGISFLDMTHMGFLVKAKFGLGYAVNNFVISVGAGYEMRNYSITVGEDKGSLNITSIPIELGISVKF